MFRDHLRRSLADIGEALREPEAFALRWHREGRPYGPGVFLALWLTAVAGTTTYGAIMGLLGGPGHMLEKAASFTFAAGVAWGLPLPALYILNGFAGSRLRASTTFLAALVTTSWGGLAMIASIPIAWFFIAAVPEHPVLPGVDLSRSALVLIVHLVVFTGVGVAMTDVFGRVMTALEPARGRAPVWWLLLVAAIGAELFYWLRLFPLPVL